MEKLFDLSKFDKYKEDNRREVKSAKSGLPATLWDTYSAFANTEGGVIILGVKEREDKSWTTTGLKNAAKLEKEFWDLANNPQKISHNLLTHKDVQSYQVHSDTIIVITVPRATREQKPIFKGLDMFKGTYRRNGEGDYLCTKPQVLAMLRDQTEDTADTKVIDFLNLSELNWDTIGSYRNMHRSVSAQHPFSRLNDDEYLRSIGAAAISKQDGKLHPTAAGLLFFGNDYDIVREFPEYFLDYQEQLDPSIRWTDRLWSTSGTWSGNVFDFFLRAYSKIAMGLKVPFQMEGIIRVDDTPVHKAVRESLVNCLSNADYFGTRGIIIRKTPLSLMLENPGNIRTGKRQMLRGGISDPRNKIMLKMFNLLDIGERSGSGVPNILNVWKDQGWPEPQIEEEHSPDRTRITLFFLNVDAKTGEQVAKTGELAAKTGELTVKTGEQAYEIGKQSPNKSRELALKADERKVAKTGEQAGKTGEQIVKTSELSAKTGEQAAKAGERNAKTLQKKRAILAYLKKHKAGKTSDIADLLKLSVSRTRQILSEMVAANAITCEGKTNARIYKIID